MAITIGERFGKWVVTGESDKKYGSLHWLCVCDCGTKKAVRERHLIGQASTCCSKCQAGKTSEAATRRLRRSPRGRLLHIGTSRRQAFYKRVVDEQFELQKGLCAVCMKPLVNDFSACFDHDHTTDEYRELVHRGCNVFIGWLERDPEVVARTLEYLEKYK
jgi:hypothetical protein